MSNLEMVNEALSSNPDVFIAGGEPVVRLKPEEYWTEWVFFPVAPREPIFNSDQLEAFRQTLLLPDVKLGNGNAVRDVFYGKNDQRNRTDIGWIAYDDTLKEQEYGAAARRRTIILVYPHPSLASVVRDVISNPSSFDKRLGTLQYWVTPKQMNRFIALVEPRASSVSQISDALARVA